MKTKGLFFLIVLAFLSFIQASATTREAPYKTFSEQLDNSVYQAVVSVISDSPVEIYNSDYIEYTLKVQEEFSADCNTDIIKAVYEDGSSSMEPGQQYLILSGSYNDYADDIVFSLGSFYLIQPDDKLVLASQKNDYTLPAEDFGIDDLRNYYSGVDRNRIEHVQIEKYLNYALQNCTSVCKGYMFRVTDNDSYTKNITSIFIGNKRITENPDDTNFTYASNIVSRDIKGGFLKPYILFSLWINDKSYDLVVTRDNPDWKRALDFYNNFSGNEYNTFTNVWLLIGLCFISLLSGLLLFFVIRRILKKESPEIQRGVDAVHYGGAR